MSKNKEFDAVISMREIREKLSKKYWNNTEILKKEMDLIRKKYNINLKGSSSDKNSLIKR